jgi:hypothetical protein
MLDFLSNTPTVGMMGTDRYNGELVARLHAIDPTQGGIGRFADPSRHSLDIHLDREHVMQMIAILWQMARDGDSFTGETIRTYEFELTFSNATLTISDAHAYEPTIVVPMTPASWGLLVAECTEALTELRLAAIAR